MQRQLQFNDEALVVENSDYLSKQLITYIGNKRALLPVIGSAVEKVKRKLGKQKLRVADIFTGSGVVARFLKAHSELVIANDIEDYACANARCYLTNRSVIELDRLTNTINELNHMAAEQSTGIGFIQELYSPKNDLEITIDDRVFYTRDNARRLDFYRQAMSHLPMRDFEFLLGPLLILSACVSSPDYPVSQSGDYVSAVASLREVPWSTLPGWQEDDLREAWPAWLLSCKALQKRASHPLDWRSACQAAKQVNGNQNQAIARYFETHMKVMEVRHANGKDAGANTGLITGYYEPYLNGSRTKGGAYQTPLHAYPKVWQRKKPSQLPSREKLLASGLLDGEELVWVDDPVAAAFMQIQGSGQIRLTDGQVMRLGFAGTNDHPFQSFAQWLLNRREITRAQATMQGISEWAKKNPSRVSEMLNANPRFVF